MSLNCCQFSLFQLSTDVPVVIVFHCQFPCMRCICLIDYGSLYPIARVSGREVVRTCCA